VCVSKWKIGLPQIGLPLLAVMSALPCTNTYAAQSARSANDMIIPHNPSALRMKCGVAMATRLAVHVRRLLCHTHTQKKDSESFDKVGCGLKRTEWAQSGCRAMSTHNASCFIKNEVKLN